MSIWKRKPKEINGVFTYLDAGGEQTIFEITPSAYPFLSSIVLDMNTITQNGTFKIYTKIDTNNYRELDEQAFTVATDSDGVVLGADFNFRLTIGGGIKLTYTEDADEGANRDIPFRYIRE